MPKSQTTPDRKPDHLVVSVKLEGQTYEIDFLNLRSRERIALERHAERPWRDLAQGWLFGSELVMSFVAYLAVARERPLFSYDDFLDRVDVTGKDGATIETRPEWDEAEPAAAPKGAAKGGAAKRPTKSQRTSGSRS